MLPVEYVSFVEDEFRNIGNNRRKGNAIKPATQTSHKNRMASHRSGSNEYVVSPMPVWKQLLSVWRTWVIIFTPLILLPLALVFNDPAGRCAYAVLIMAVYWCTEAIPIAATALLPFALMPWLGIISAKVIAQNYLKDTNFLFFGGLLVAVAIERWNLHKRIALRVLLIVGSKPMWLMFGFMLTTAFLSMWLSNTATTAMMVPIAQAVLMELKQHRKTAEESSLNPDAELANNTNENGGEFTQDSTENKIYPMLIEENSQRKRSFGSGRDTNSSIQAEDTSFKKLCIGLTLCICYAANIGGIATLTGTGPNLILKGQLDVLYGSGHGLNFTSWMLFALPVAIICLFLAWVWLVLLYIGPKTFVSCFRRNQPTADSDVAAQVIRREYEKLGPMSFAEIATLIHFVLLAVLWLTREPEFMPGWSTLFTEGYVTDACVGMSVAVLLFVFPSEKPNILCFRRSDSKTKPGPVPALLDWETVHSKMAWSVIIVLGGGFALADATQKSGLSKSIGNSFNEFGDLPVWVLVLMLSLITAGVTEVASNTATATIFLPILAELGEGIGVNPMYLMMPCTISASFAFMLPVATPPNAIVFAYGHMKIIDMVKCGFLMNIACVLVLTFGINTWAYAYFDLGTIPTWVGSTTTQAVLNATIAPSFNG